MGVPQDVRSPRADVIDVAVAVDVIEASPFAALDEQRLAAHSSEGPGGAVDPAGDDPRGALEALVASFVNHANSKANFGVMLYSHSLVDSSSVGSTHPKAESPDMSQLSSPVAVRPARGPDIRPLAELIGPFVKDRKLLPRAIDELALLLPNYFVADAGGRLVRCSALQISSRKLPA